MSRRFVYYGVGRSADSLLLDLYPAEVAYSLRKLRTDYNGSAIRVRRSSDNAEMDIGFLGNDLDTASLLAFCGVNDGRVAVLYDQSLNGINKIQPSASNQPYIVDQGELLTENSKPAIYRTKPSENITTWMYAPHTFPTGDILTTNVFVGKRIAGSGFAALVGIAPLQHVPNDRRHVKKSIESTTSFAVRLEGGNTLFNSGSGYVQSLFSSWREVVNTNFKARRNGVNLAVASSGASKNLNIQADSAFTIFQTGGRPYTDSNPPVNGIFQETIWWLNDESANLQAIETNINNYYAIY